MEEGVHQASAEWCGRQYENKTECERREIWADKRTIAAKRLKKKRKKNIVDKWICNERKLLLYAVRLLFILCFAFDTSSTFVLILSSVVNAFRIDVRCVQRAHNLMYLLLRMCRAPVFEIRAQIYQTQSSMRTKKSCSTKITCKSSNGNRIHSTRHLHSTINMSRSLIVLYIAYWRATPTSLFYFYSICVPTGNTRWHRCRPTTSAFPLLMQICVRNTPFGSTLLLHPLSYEYENESL